MIGWVVLTSTRTSSARRFLEVSQSWLLHASIWAFATLTADVSVFMARCLLVAASPGLDAGCQFRHRSGPKSGRSCPIQSVLLVKPVWTAVKGRMRRGELLLPGHLRLPSGAERSQRPRVVCGQQGALRKACPDTGAVLHPSGRTRNGQ